MKNLFKSLILLLVIVSVSCDSDTSDMMTSDSVDGGALLKVMPSIGKTLGNPLDVVDLENTQVSFTDVELDLTVQLQFGGENITKYEIVKTFKKREVDDGDDDTYAEQTLPGAESIVATGPSLPLNVHYTSIAEYMANTEISDANDLNIGDEFIFRTKMYTSSGAVHYSKESTYIVTVSCASDLEGAYKANYSNTTLPPHVLTKIGEGLYEMNSMIGWPTSNYKVKLQDVCGTVEILDDWQFSNHIGGEGIVDSVTGDISFTGVFVEDQYSSSAWYFTKQ
ncbi:MAG TPA: hypothetical protein EYG92_04480 [Lutibacter sp.]|nr:hypothetical protein [Lutibacter sp.]